MRFLLVILACVSLVSADAGPKFKSSDVHTQDEFKNVYLNLGRKVEFKNQTPSSSTEGCSPGAFQWDASFMYVCTATGTWKRAALSAF